MYRALDSDLGFDVTVGGEGVMGAILTDKERHIVILFLKPRFTRVYILYFLTFSKAIRSIAL